PDLARGPRFSLSSAGAPFRLREPPLGDLQVGEAQLGFDHFQIAERVDLTVRMGDLWLPEGAHHVDDRVDVPDVAEKPVTKALPPVSAPHEARDVDELDVLEAASLDAQCVGDSIEAFVRNRNDRHVW